MTWLEAAVWGLFGGFAVEGLEFVRAIRRTGDWPWRQPDEPGPVPLAASVVIRLTVGAGLAVATVTAEQVQGPFGALAVGVAAPLLIEQILGSVPVGLAAPAVVGGPEVSAGAVLPVLEESSVRAGQASARVSQVTGGGEDAA